MQVDKWKPKTLNDQIKRLKELSLEDLERCLEEVLSGETSRSELPEVASIGQVDPFVLVLQWYRASKDRDFQRKLRQCIINLLGSWDPTVHTLDYLTQLLALVGYCRIFAARPILVKLAVRDNGVLKGMNGPAGDLHLLLLRVLLSWNILDEKGEDRLNEICEESEPFESATDLLWICKRDINDPRYTGICYRALWEADPRYGIQYLPILWRFIDEGKEDLKAALSQFVNALRANQLLELLKYCDQLPDPIFNRTVSMLVEFGVYCIPSPDGLYFYIVKGKDYFVCPLSEDPWYKILRAFSKCRMKRPIPIGQQVDEQTLERIGVR